MNIFYELENIRGKISHEKVSYLIEIQRTILASDWSTITKKARSNWRHLRRVRRTFSKKKTRHSSMKDVSFCHSWRKFNALNSTDTRKTASTITEEISIQSIECSSLFLEQQMMETYRTRIERQIRKSSDRSIRRKKCYWRKRSLKEDGRETSSKNIHL